MTIVWVGNIYNDHCLGWCHILTRLLLPPLLWACVAPILRLLHEHVQRRMCGGGFRLKRHGQVWPLVIWGGKKFNNLQLTFDWCKGMNNKDHYIQLCQSLFKQPSTSQWPCIDRIDTSLARKTCQMQSQQQMLRMLCKVMGLFDYLLKICFLLIDLSWQRPFWTHFVAPSDTLTRTEQTCFMDRFFCKAFTAV